MPDHHPTAPAAPPAPDAHAARPPVGAAPVPTQQPARPRNPYATLAIVGFILSFLVPVNIVGLAVCTVAVVKSKQAGYTSKLGIAGVIISAIFLVLMGVFLLFFFVFFMPIFLEGF